MERETLFAAFVIHSDRRWLDGFVIRKKSIKLKHLLQNPQNIEIFSTSTFVVI